MNKVQFGAVMMICQIILFAEKQTVFTGIPTVFVALYFWHIYRNQSKE